MTIHTAFNVLDLFCGCGGLSLGFSLASRDRVSFQTIAGIDNWGPACESFKKNGLGQAICASITPELITRLVQQYPLIDIVIGGPPCQGFSTSGKRQACDQRNDLVKLFVESVAIIRPKAFVMENVPGIVTLQDGIFLREVIRIAQNAGYYTYAGILLASLYGVPQRRRRFFLVGLQTQAKFFFPAAKMCTSEKETKSAACIYQGALFEDIVRDELILSQDHDLENSSCWTFDQATTDLPEIPAGSRADMYASPPRNEYQLWCRQGYNGPLTEHISSAHRPSFIEMMSYIPPGKSALDPEVQSLMPAHLRPRSGYPNSYTRIRGDLPAPTITRNFTTPSSAACIHPRQHRGLTLREGARCQSFPDWFRFSGSFSDRRLMIGNAVPPLLAKALAEALLETLISSNNMPHRSQENKPLAFHNK